MPSVKAINDTMILLNHSNIELSQTVFTSIMNIHLVPSILYGEDLKFDQAQEITTGLPVSTLIVNSGLSLSIAGQGNKALGQVLETDTIIRGGVIHWIDIVLLPDLSSLMNLRDKNTTVFPNFLN